MMIYRVLLLLPQQKPNWEHQLLYKTLKYPQQKRMGLTVK